MQSKNSCFTNVLRAFTLHGLWTRGLGPNLLFEPGLTPLSLFYMSYRGVSGVVQLLLDDGVDVNAELSCRGNVLLGASENGHEGVVRLLLENGVNVNAEGGPYGNALLVASSNGREEVVQLLLDNGANFNAEGGYDGNAVAGASE